MAQTSETAPTYVSRQIFLYLVMDSQSGLRGKEQAIVLPGAFNGNGFVKSFKYVK